MRKGIKTAVCVCVVVCILAISAILAYRYLLVDNELLNVNYLDEEICIDIPNSESKIVVKSWTYLTQSSTEFYYKYSNGKMKKIEVTFDLDAYYCIKSGRSKVDFFDDRVEFLCTYNAESPNPTNKSIVCYYPS